MEALECYQTLTAQVVMIEYILIANVNSSVETAKQLGELLAGRQVWINIIPYNPTDVGDKFGFESPTTDMAVAFRNEVMRHKDHKGNPLFCKVRWSTTNGRGVDGACGQLALKNVEGGSNSAGSAGSAGSGSGARVPPGGVVGDIEDTFAPGANAKAKAKGTAAEGGKSNSKKGRAIESPEGSKNTHEPMRGKPTCKAVPLVPLGRWFGDTAGMARGMERPLLQFALAVGLLLLMLGIWW
jgi:hypothetical protein